MPTSGIYQICNTRNGKIYIGSSTDIDKRWKKHIHTLKEGTHYNYRLQSEFNKYGENVFTFDLVEEVPPREELLLTAEQKWLDNIQCYRREYGYNIEKIARRERKPLTRKRDPFTKQWLVTSPDGSTFTVWGLFALCREYRLSCDAMRNVAKGNQLEHRGWICNYVNEDKKREAGVLRKKLSRRRITNHTEWTVTDPDGNFFQTRNLTGFCKREKLDIGCMKAVAKGGAKQHKGWVCDYTDEDKKREAEALREKITRPPSLIITSPAGEEFCTNNLTDFCLQHGLNPTSMRTVAVGETKQHKGWVCDYTDEDKKREAEKTREWKKQRKTFLLTNPEGVTLQTQNLGMFCEENDLNYGRMRAIAQGAKRRHGEWFCDYMDQDKQEYAEILRKKRQKRTKR